MVRSTEQAREQLLGSLSSVYGEGEALAMTRMVMEDVFSWKPGQRIRDLTEKEWNEFLHIQERLLAQEPVQYVTGTADFYGLRLQVNPAVLIPRPETEELVEWVLERAQILLTQKPIVRVLDIGTGSGCIPLSLKKESPSLKLSGWDISKDALEVARTNAQQLKLDVTFSEVDILKPSQWLSGSWDIIISNPPYIPYQETELMPQRVLKHEPDLALFVPNEDPLLFYRTIMEFAKQHGAARTYLFFECNEYNASTVDQLGQALGFTQTALRKDMQGKDRMWCGCLG